MDLDLLEEQNQLARRMILPCLVVGAQTPRAALEVQLGRRATEEEWDKLREPWERNWEDCVQLYADVKRLLAA